MSNNDNDNKPGNVQADHNSTAIGRDVNIQGVENSKIHIGNVIYNEPKPPDLREYSKTHYFEPDTIYIAEEGPFLMGCQPGADIPEYEQPEHEVTLPTFRISIGAVTNSQYAEFISQTNRPAPTGWIGRKVPSGVEDRPVMGVTWYDAVDYCTWLSNITGRKYSLPNEAELEKLYRCSDDFTDNADKVHQWTCSLWGEKVNAPDQKYAYPWKDDGRNNMNANRQIRRVICTYFRPDSANPMRLRKRIGELPGEAGLPGARYGFRVVMSI